MSKISDQEKWEQYAAQFYGPFQQPTQAVQPVDPSAKGSERIEPSFEVKGYNGLRDTLATAQYTDPSNYGGSPLIPTGKAGTAYSVVDINFRVADFIGRLMMPIVRFVAVPEGFKEEGNRQEVKAGEARNDLRRRMRVAETGRIPGVVMSAMRRLANDAFAHLASWLMGDRLALLPGQVKLLAGKLKIVSKSWMEQTLDTLSEGLSTAMSWFQGFLKRWTA